MITKLVLIRHGVTDWNKEKRYCGLKDAVLSSEGRSQAVVLGNKLKFINFDKIYTSDRKRAIQTAGIIFKDIRTTKVRNLKEMNFGVFEGLRYKDIIQKYPGIYKKWLRDPFKNNIPKAENLNSFKKRVNNCLKRIVSCNRGKTVAIVCHGGTISIFITSILKIRDFWRYIPKSASISIVEFRNNKPELKLFNRL